MSTLKDSNKQYDYKKDFYDSQQKQSMHQMFIDGLIKHEGLEPGQTPFRITSDEMRTWSTIHGLPIDWEKVPSKGRENFIYLKDANQVPIAVDTQFYKYYTNPKAYKLPKNPTIENAIRKFDQTGADGKIKYLKKLGIDVSLPLGDFYAQ